MRNVDAIEKLKGGQSHRNYDMGKRHNRQQKQRKNRHIKQSTQGNTHVWKKVYKIRETILAG